MVAVSTHLTKDLVLHAKNLDLGLVREEFWRRQRRKGTRRRLLGILTCKVSAESGMKQRIKIQRKDI